jgi:putative exporter of polyketide antibiotics
MPAASFELLPTVLLSTIAVGLTLLGIVAINRRDIG